MASKDKLKELLNYSTSLSSGTATTTIPDGNSRRLDPALLDQIMGPDDAQLMIQSMQAICSSTLSEEEYDIAFDNLEALVEQIDNAKNLQNCRLWTPLLEQLNSSRASHRTGAATVIATALQNNPDSQADFLAYGNAGLPKLLHLFAEEVDVGVRRKVSFAITCALRNCAAALQKFDEIHGWAAISKFLDTPGDLNMMRRIVFFLGTLYASNGEDGFQAVSTPVKTGFPPKLVQLLSNQQIIDDEDLAEKILYTLAQSLKFDSDVLNCDLKDKLKRLASTVEEKYGQEFYEGRELDGLL